MNHTGLLWAAGTCTTSLGACGGGLILHQARTARRRVVDRMASITGPYRPSGVQERRRELASVRAGASPMARIERLFGFERDKRSKSGRPFAQVAGATGAVSVLAALILQRMFGDIAWCGGIILWVALSRVFYHRLQRRHCAALFRQFPDALGMIVRAVRVGVPLNGAVRMVSEEAADPTAAEFRQLSEEISIGRPIGDALRSMSIRNDLPEYRFFATALSLQSQTGGGLSETLDTLADTIRKRVAARLRGRALASEARTSCYVLGALPFFVGALLYLSNPGYMSVLFTTSPGLELLGAALASLSAGLYLMNLITKATLE